MVFSLDSMFGFEPRKVRWLSTVEEGLYRRKGKGRHCYLGDKMYLIPCRASYFTLGEIHPIFKLSYWPSAKSKIASVARNGINLVPQTASTTFALFFFIYLSFMLCTDPKAIKNVTLLAAVKLHLGHNHLLALVYLLQNFWGKTFPILNIPPWKKIKKISWPPKKII